MPVIIRSETGATVETVYWIDFRTNTAGVGLRRDGDAWADHVGVGTLTMEWATEGSGKLTAEERGDCLRFLATAVYE